LALCGLLTPLVGCPTWSQQRTYDRQLDAHTQKLVIYDGFATALIMRGTYLSAEFRDLMADERERLIQPADADRIEFARRMDDDGSAYHEIVFSADSALEEADQFGTSDDGWILRLMADGQEETLVTSYRVRRPSPLHQNLYSHLNIWSELWIVRFARTVESPDEVILHVGSGYGNGTLRWEPRH
jgi:hypothetical protein